MKTNIHSIIQSLAYSLIVVVGVWLASCEEQQLLYKDLAFVRFTDTALIYKEYFPKTIKIKVHNGGAPLDESIIVNYKLGGTAREGKDYRIDGNKGTVVIAPKQNFGEINLVLLNNANNILESSTIEFTLTGVNPSDKVKVGLGEGGLGTKMLFTIRDACIMEGLYSGLLPSKFPVVATTPYFQKPDIDIVSTDCKTYTITNINVGLLGFPQFFGYEAPVGFQAEKPTLTFVDNGNNTLTIPKQVITEFVPGYDTLSGTGIWNPLNRRITLNVRWKITKISNGRDSVVNIPLTYIPQ